MRRLLPAFLVSLCWGSPAEAFTPKAGSPMANRSHPRLHFTEANLPTVRTAIATHYRPQFQEYVNWAATPPSEDAQYDNLYETGHDPFRAAQLHQAFIGMLGVVPGVSYPISPSAFSRKAINRLLFCLNRGDDLAYVPAMVYDWTFNSMSAGERSQAANLMAGRAVAHKIFSFSVNSPSFTSDEMFSSKYYEGCYPFYIGLALWGDGLVDAAADGAVGTFSTAMTNHGYLDAHNFASGQDGGYSEWIGYASWHPRTHNVLVDAWRTATGENYITNLQGSVNGNAMLRWGEFIWYSIDPQKLFNEHYTYVRLGDAQTTDSSLQHVSMVEQLQMMSRILHESGATTQAGLVRHFIESFDVEWLRWEHNYLMGWMGLAKSVPAVTPAEAGLRPSRWSRNLGLFFARTGFTSPADGVFSASDGHFDFAGHAGPDDYPGFTLSKFGDLVNTRNVSHRGYGNLNSYPGGQQMNIVYFAGGHLADRSGTGLESPAQLREALSGQGGRDGGGIEQVTRRDGRFYHVRVDRSRQLTTGVTHTREYVWLPGNAPASDSDFLVVYDRTRSPSLPEWVYHMPWEPTASGHSSSSSLNTGSGTSDRIGTRYEGTGIVVKELNSKGDVADGDNGEDFVGGGGAHGVAFHKTVLPATARVEATRVAAFDDDVMKRQFHLAIKSHRWQVSVLPTTTELEHRFLNVFQTADANRVASMTPSTLLESAGDLQGVWVERENANRPNYAVLFSKTADSPKTVASYTVTGSGEVRHVITGLDPSKAYRITDGTTTIDQNPESDTDLWDYKGVKTNRASGVVYFESTLNGSKTYTLLAQGVAEAPLAPPKNVRVTY